MSPRALPMLVAAVLATACSGPGALPEPPDEYPHATAMADCAPWDGTATSVFLSAEPADPEAPIGSEVPPPHLWISVYDGADALAGERFEIDQDRSAGAALCTDEGPCRPATGGWIRFRDGSTREILTGEFEVEIGSAGVPSDGSVRSLAGGFRASWHERRILCG